MARSESPTHYWDANLFIYLLNRDPVRWPLIQPLWDAALAGELQIATSNFTIAEVAFSSDEAEDRVLKDEQRIDEMLSGGEHVQIIPFDNQIAYAARTLLRRWLIERPAALGRMPLAPSDALHLASAASVEAATFYTFDQRLTQIAGLLHVLPAAEP